VGVIVGDWVSVFVGEGAIVFVNVGVSDIIDKGVPVFAGPGVVISSEGAGVFVGDSSLEIVASSPQPVINRIIITIRMAKR